MFKNEIKNLLNYAQESDFETGKENDFYKYLRELIRLYGVIFLDFLEKQIDNNKINNYILVEIIRFFEIDDIRPENYEKIKDMIAKYINYDDYGVRDTCSRVLSSDNIKQADALIILNKRLEIEENEELRKIFEKVIEEREEY